jgi:hypothetical protein
MKPFVFLFILLISYNSYSQSSRPVIEHTDKGMKMIGGQLQLANVDLFSSETILRVNDYSSEAGIVVSPNIGWFVEKNWLLGSMGHLGFYSSKSNKNSTFVVKEKAFDIGITPFSRYYIDLTRRRNVKLFLLAGLPLIYSSYNVTYNSPTSTDEDRSNLGIHAVWGVGTSLHGQFGAIEMNLSSLGLNLGFQKFIGRK